MYTISAPTKEIEKYVIVAGTFDLFHVGHVNLLRRAAKFGKVIALVNTDRFVEEFKGKKPHINEKDRRHMIETCKYVEITGYNDDADLSKTIDYSWQMQILGIVFGDDYDIKQYRKQTGITPEWQLDKDVALIQVPRTPDVSSSDIKSGII